CLLIAGRLDVQQIVAFGANQLNFEWRLFDDMTNKDDAEAGGQHDSALRARDRVDRFSGRLGDRFGFFLLKSPGGRLRRNPERSALVDEQRVYAIREQAIGGELLNSLAVVSRKAGVGAEQDRPIGILRYSSNLIGWEPVKKSDDSPSMNVGLLKILF